MQQTLRAHLLQSNCVCRFYLQYCWRWTGFSFGVDVIMTYSPRTRQLLLRRNTNTHPTGGVVCLQEKRNLLVRVAAASLDSKGYNSSYYKCSGLLDLSLDSDEEKPVLQLDRKVAFPLSVSVYIVLVSASNL